MTDRLLWVEGKDDIHVIYSLVHHFAVPESFKVEEKKGLTVLLEAFEVALLNPAAIAVLGVVVDADTNPVGRWQSLSNILATVGYTNLPATPAPFGTIITEANLAKVGIWLMPDNTSEGMLENFVASLVVDPETDPLWLLSEKCLQEALSISPDIPPTKGRLHTYLAWQNDPGTPLGQAITKKYFDPTKPEAQGFINWLNQLFN